LSIRADSDSIHFSAAGLVRLARAIVERGGSGAEEAQLVADNLVLADTSGHVSHGVGMLPRYVDALLEGGLIPNRTPRVELDTGVLLRLDGGWGYGQVAGRDAMVLGAERAKRHGVCVVALHDAHHLGRIGHWAEACVDAGLVSLHFVNVVSRPIVAPFGGLDARTGTNPVCIGVSRLGQPPLVLDFATSRIAQGKVRLAFNRGEALPPDTVIDDRGEPTNDPRYTQVPPFGAILPFGEHKGFGLGLIAELLGGALCGGLTLHESHAGKRRIHNGMLSILIDPAQLGTASWVTETEAYLEWLRRSPVAAGSAGVRLPGEPERENRERCARDGVALDRQSWEEIVGAAAQLGLERAQCEALSGPSR
jgi:hydroxycarboxylate dehydrogenase B